jgi:hypothetical protein
MKAKGHVCIDKTVACKISSLSCCGVLKETRKVLMHYGVY